MITSNTALSGDSLPVDSTPSALPTPPSQSNYTLYGLHIVTDRALPGLGTLLSPTPVDIHVWFDAPSPLPESIDWVPHPRFTSHRDSDQGEAAWLTVLATTDGAFALLRYGDGVEFIVDQAATQIWCTWPAAFTFEYVVSYITNPVLGFCLRLRERACLHASAVVVGDGALLFSAPSGHGKSTTASYFALRGHVVVADDISVLKASDGLVQVEPGYPHLRLWDKSANALLGAAESLPTIAPDWEKRYFDFQRHGLSFATQSMPIKGICLLKPRYELTNEPDAAEVLPLVQIERVPPIRALGLLMDNMYMNYLLDHHLRTIDFSLLGRLVGRVPVYYVTAPDNLSRLSALYDTILATFSAS